MKRRSKFYLTSFLILCLMTTGFMAVIKMGVWEYWYSCHLLGAENIKRGGPSGWVYQPTQPAHSHDISTTFVSTTTEK